MKAVSAIFAQNIRRYRELRGFTQAQLAEKVSISINFLSTIEGDKKFPSPRIIDRFAEAFGVAGHHLFMDWDEVEGIDNELLGNALSKTFLDGLEKNVMGYTEKYFRKG